jgi:hypothetical protein
MPTLIPAAQAQADITHAVRPGSWLTLRDTVPNRAAVDRQRRQPDRKAGLTR